MFFWNYRKHDTHLLLERVKTASICNIFIRESKHAFSWTLKNTLNPQNLEHSHEEVYCHMLRLKKQEVAEKTTFKNLNYIQGTDMG